MPKLTEKQKKFINEYLIDLNGTQAAIRAGYSGKTANRIAAENLAHPVIQKVLSQRIRDREKRTEITQDRVLQEFARLGFFDPRKLFNADGSPKDITDLDDDTAAAVAGLEVMEVYEGRGDDRAFVGYVKKYKLADKKGALDSLAKHLGMFIERHEHTGRDGGPIGHSHKPNLAALTDEELSLLERIVIKSANHGGDQG